MGYGLYMPKNSVDNLGNSIEDYQQMICLKKHLNPNFSKKNFMIDIYRRRSRNPLNAVPVDDFPSKKDQVKYMEGRAAVQKLYDNLPQEDWILLVQWFMGDYDSKAISSSFYYKIEKIKKKCKTILSDFN